MDFEPSWSPAGNRVVYAHSNVTNDLSGIYIVNSDGTGNTQLAETFSRSPDWFPNANKILFSQADQIFKINLNGDSLIQLTTSEKNLIPKISNDEEWVAYSNYDGNKTNVWIMKPDGQQKTLLEENADYPNWFAGSNSLMYFKSFKNSDGTPRGDTLIVHTVASNTKQVVRIFDSDDHRINLYPGLAGTEIIFCSMNQERYSYIYKMQIDGSNVQRLTDTQGYSPAYSNFNQKIVYTNRDLGNGRLWIMDRNGNNKIQLTH